MRCFVDLQDIVSPDLPNKRLKRTAPSVTPPAGTEAQASRHSSATPLSHTVRVPVLRELSWQSGGLRQ
jgi:hypothetical protein